MRSQYLLGLGVAREGHAHALAVGHHQKQPAGVVSDVGIHARSGDGFMEAGGLSDVADEVRVEEIAIARPAEEPGPSNGIVEPAEGFHDVDPSPAGNSISEPEESLGASRPSLQGVCCKRTEPVGQQSNRLDQGNVVDRSHGGDQGEPHGY
ncbi:hypothetical protein OHB49_04135 [Streptomyces sp. NBC_01717]|uniref:hypothetical protein n=1 Tax=Streptomyces sp. NBC_01717 TaxID=2975918 RepID=UPI002E2F63E7|nr:hypothetical protein [Streptomyces sp. NBC_01717]